MKTLQKWLLVLAVCTALLAAVKGLASPKRQMRAYAEANRAALDAFAQECLSRGAPYSGTFDGRVAAVPADDPERVIVSWSAFGIAPASKYYELHYFADGDPHPAPGMEHYDELAQMFGWRWVQPNGDNGCYVEHIDGSWYYVESWF